MCIQIHMYVCLTHFECVINDKIFVPVQVQLEVDVKFVQDTLRGDDLTEIRVKFIKKLEDAIPAGEN